MDAAIDIGALRRLARCMAIDVGVFLVTLADFAIVLVVSIVIDAMPDSLANKSMVMLDVLNYVKWTGQIVQIVAWALSIEATSRLARTWPTFTRARAFMIARVLLFVGSHVIDALLGNPYGYITGSEAAGFSAIGLAYRAVWFIAFSLTPMLACHSTLHASADLLDSCGMVEPAKASRTHARHFGIVGVMFPVIAIAAYLCLTAVNAQAGHSLPGDTGLLLPLLLGSALATAVVGIAYLVLWVSTAVRMERTQRLVEELTR